MRLGFNGVQNSSPGGGKPRDGLKIGIKKGLEHSPQPERKSAKGRGHYPDERHQEEGFPPTYSFLTPGDQTPEHQSGADGDNNG
ncbi:MAG: hypothetical protein DDT27_01486 [Dehalococcoidia bacterium]|nr:hypothetical protein [Chloroflexota bacterium]